MICMNSQQNWAFVARPLVSLVTISLLASCSSLPPLPAASSFPSLTQNVDNYKYLIGPGDSLNIFVWRNPEISGSFTVRPDGMITTSLVEDIPVSGRTPTQLARDVEAQLSTYLRDPIVTVTVNGFIGPFSEQVRVIGEASEPKAINYRENMTLLDVMIEVGGLTDFADGDDARLIRIVADTQQEYGLQIDSLLRDGEIRGNVDILPGDIIIIPESWF